MNRQTNFPLMSWYCSCWHSKIASEWEDVCHTQVSAVPCSNCNRWRRVPWYVEESSRIEIHIHERSKEHLGDWGNRSSKSHSLKRQELSHSGEQTWKKIWTLLGAENESPDLSASKWPSVSGIINLNLKANFRPSPLDKFLNWSIQPKNTMHNA